MLATTASVVEADSWTLRQLEFLVERLVDNALLVATEVDASVAVDAMCEWVAAVAHFVPTTCPAFDYWFHVRMLLRLWLA